MESLYDRIGHRLSRLIPQFGLEDRREMIQQAYRLICSKSLAIPVGRRAPNISRINDDGTPFQFSVAMGHFKPPLQFLGEVIEAGNEGSADRLAQSKAALHSIANLFGVQGQLAEVMALIDEMVPSDDSRLLTDSAGALWIGASFSPSGEPKLKIYLNMKWGTQAEQWKRLNRLAAYFNSVDQWQASVPLIKTQMEPLGVAITLSQNQPPSGRIYLSAYGQPIRYYESLAELTANNAFRSMFRPYVETLLGEDCHYPTQSVVCSWGFNKAEGMGDFKFEMCAHRIFASDAAAMEKCMQWLRLQKMEPDGYLKLLDALSLGVPSDTEPRLHCYVGLGCRRDKVYSTFYFNPGTH